jgi:serine/threonine-protein kinase
LREAEALFAEAIAVSTKVSGDPNPILPRLFAYLGETQQKLLEFAPAETSFRRALDVARRLNGEDHVDTLETELRLGQFLFATSRIKEGLHFLEHAKDSALRTRGPDDAFYTPQMLLEYGWALLRSGRLEEGLAYISQAVENRRKNRPGTRYLGQMLEDQARAFLDLGREAQARKTLDEAETIGRQVSAPPNYVGLEDRVRLLVSAGDAEAAANAIRTYEGSMPKSTGLSMESLNVALLKSEIALVRGDAAEAVRLAAEVSETLRTGPAASVMGTMVARAALSQGRAALILQRPTEALPLLKQAVELRRELLDAASPALADAQVALAMCDLHLGERAQASALFARAKAIQEAHRELSREFRAPLQQLDQRLR